MARLPLAESIRINLETVESAIADLPEFAEAPDDWTGWDAEWWDVMMRLEWLLDQAERGRLDEAQVARCQESLRGLGRLLPLAEEHELSVPERLLVAARAAASSPTRRSA